MGKWDDKEKCNHILMIGVSGKNATEQPVLVPSINKQTKDRFIFNKCQQDFVENSLLS